MQFGDSNGQNTIGGAKLLERFFKGVTAMLRFRANLTVVEKFGEGKGATVNWSVFAKLPKVTAPIGEGNVMSLVNPPVIKGSLVVDEYGDGIPFTNKLQVLSELNIKSIFEDTLGQQCGESLDGLAGGAYEASNVRAVPAGTGFDSLTDVIITTNGTPAGINNAPLTKAHVRKILAYMKMNNYPTKDGMYYCIGTPAALVNLKQELDTTFQYTETGFNRIVNGLIGKLDNCLFVEQTNVIVTPWSNGKSDKAYFFGDENGIEVVVTPEELRDTIPTDFGRNYAVGWYYIGGFGKIRNDRVVVWDSVS